MTCPLTAQQKEIVHWLSLGKTGMEIEEIIGISSRAIQRRIDRAYQATGASTRYGLVALALRKGWIE